MIIDMLNYLNRRQLDATAKDLGMRPGRYKTKVKLIEAIRRKRAAK